MSDCTCMHDAAQLENRALAAEAETQRWRDEYRTERDLLAQCRAERDIYRRKAEVRAEELEMGSVDPLLFDGLRDAAESARIALRNEKKIHDQTRADLAAAREALARVEALADRWKKDDGVVVARCLVRLRAALAPTREEDR